MRPIYMGFVSQTILQLVEYKLITNQFHVNRFEKLTYSVGAREFVIKPRYVRIVLLEICEVELIKYL